VPTGGTCRRDISFFVRNGALMAAPFDLARLEVTGPAVTVVPRLMQALNAPMS